MELGKKLKKLNKQKTDEVAKTEKNVKKKKEKKRRSKGEQFQKVSTRGKNQKEMNDKKLENQLIEFEKEKPKLEKMEIQLAKLEEKLKILGWEQNRFLCKVELENKLIEIIRKILMKSKRGNNNKTSEKVVKKKNDLGAMKKGRKNRELLNLRKELSQLKEEFKISQDAERELKIYADWEEDVIEFEKGNVKSKLEEEQEILEEKGEKKIKNSKRFQYSTEFGIMEKKVKKINHRNKNRLDFLITKTWDNRKINHVPVKITLLPGNGNEVLIKISAPFFNDSLIPNGKSGEPFNKLWDYEVVGAFFLDQEGNYLEVEFSPHGQHLLRLFSGSGEATKLCLPVKYNSCITGNEWSGTAKIPSEYFQSSVHLFNAYAIHGSGDNRVHETLYPVPTHHFEKPNFHRLKFFSPIEFHKVLPSNPLSKMSSLWKQVLQRASEVPFVC